MRNTKALHQYFDVMDIRDIRKSKRFLTEIAPLFRGDVILSHDTDLNLVVVGTWKDRGKESVGIYTLATSGPDAGLWVRAAMTY